jgi:hypothetical protein
MKLHVSSDPTNWFVGAITGILDKEQSGIMSIGKKKKL